MPMIELYLANVGYGYLRNYGTDGEPDWAAVSKPDAMRFNSEAAAEKAIRRFREDFDSTAVGIVEGLGF